MKEIHQVVVTEEVEIHQTIIMKHNYYQLHGGCSNNDNGNLLTISSNGCNGVENDLLTINTSYPTNNSNDSGCSCNGSTSNDSIAVRANVFPNNNTNGRTGSFCGCFRRR